MRVSSIGEMIENSIGETTEISIREMIENSIEEMMKISIKDRVDHEILGLEQSFVVNVEPVNSGSSHELDGTAVITRIYPSKL
jgi:HSP90 family molecular chaperone